jgi:hypothetical protein
MQAAWVEKHRPEVQRLANALVKALRFIDEHPAEEIAARMPPDYYAGDRALYVQALADGKAMFTRDGRMPPHGPETVLKVLSAFNKPCAAGGCALALAPAAAGRLDPVGPSAFGARRPLRPGAGSTGERRPGRMAGRGDRGGRRDQRRR